MGSARPDRGTKEEEKEEAVGRDESYQLIREPYQTKTISPVNGSYFPYATGRVTLQYSKTDTDSVDKDEQE